MNPEGITFLTSKPITIFSLSPSVVWLVIAVVSLIVGIYTIILLYHWKKYSLRGSILAKMTVLVYMVGTGGLLFLLLVAGVIAT